MLLDRATVPVNPPILVRVMVDVPVDPRLMVRLVGLAAIAKLGLGAFGIVSGTGQHVPFAMSMQTPPPTLVLEQPVWKSITDPEVVVMTLYIAVNRSPDAPGGVVPPGNAPGAAIAARWSVSTVSVVSEQVAPPATNTP
jgi:hypothetical protein